jgi:hypothetical protein
MVFLGNKDSFSSSPASFNYATCRLGKSKTLLFFPMHGNHVSTCFEIVYTDVWGVIPIISYD